MIGYMEVMAKDDFGEQMSYPRSLAIIGVSANPVNYGGIYLKANLDYAYQGKIFRSGPKVARSRDTAGSWEKCGPETRKRRVGVPKSTRKEQKG